MEEPLGTQCHYHDDQHGWDQKNHAHRLHHGAALERSSGSMQNFQSLPWGWLTKSLNNRRHRPHGIATLILRHVIPFAYQPWCLPWSAMDPRRRQPGVQKPPESGSEGQACVLETAFFVEKVSGIPVIHYRHAELRNRKMILESAVMLYHQGRTMFDTNPKPRYPGKSFRDHASEVPH